MKNKHYPMVGLETSRKVGWAKYYEAQEELRGLQRLLKRMCEEVLYDPRMRVDDRLVLLAQEILKSLAQK